MFLTSGLTPHLFSTSDPQELERGLVREDEVPSKLNELCKLCGSNKLIPDSMKLKADVVESLKVTEYTHPSQIFQSTFKGRKVAVKILRLYVPRKIDEPLTVSTFLCIRERDSSW